VRREIVLGHADAKPLEQVGPASERRGERPEMHDLAECVFGERLERRLGDPTLLQRRGEFATACKQVPVAVVRTAVLGHAIKRLVLTHATTQEDFEHSLGPERLRNDR
jgi:hypothetical protein